MRPSDALNMVFEEDEKPLEVDFEERCAGCGCTADELEEVIARCSNCNAGPYCQDCFMGKHLIMDSPECDE